LQRHPARDSRGSGEKRAGRNGDRPYRREGDNPKFFRPPGRAAPEAEPTAEVESEVATRASRQFLPLPMRCLQLRWCAGVPMNRHRSGYRDRKRSGRRILLEDLKPTVAGVAKRPSRKGSPDAEGPPDGPPGRLPPQATPGAAPAAAQPQSRMRAAIARTVSDSWRTIPHFSVTVEIRMDAAEQLRHQLKAAGTAVSMTACWSRRRRWPSPLSAPECFAAGEQEILHPEINMGIVCVVMTVCWCRCCEAAPGCRSPWWRSEPRVWWTVPATASSAIPS